MPSPHFTSYTEARTHLKAILDAAEQGRATTVRRDNSVAAVVDADRLRHTLSLLIPARAEVVPEAGGWSVFLPGYPIAADGGGFDEAVEEMVGALREYAEDWEGRLRLAPNHTDNWSLVQLITLSSDSELRSWITGEPT